MMGVGRIQQQVGFIQTPGWMDYFDGPIFLFFSLAKGLAVGIIPRRNEKGWSPSMMPEAY